MVVPRKTFQLTFTTYAISLLIGTVKPEQNLQAGERTVSKDYHSSEIQGDPLPFYKIGHDYEGLPVYLAEFGKWDYEGLASKSEDYLHEYWKRKDGDFRDLNEDAERNNGQGIVLILDFDSFSPTNVASAGAMELALKVLTRTVRVNQSLCYGFIINANFFASTFINMAKPFLGDILEKFEIYTVSAMRWKPALLRKIPGAQLPPQYGGSQPG